MVADTPYSNMSTYLTNIRNVYKRKQTTNYWTKLEMRFTYGLVSYRNFTVLLCWTVRASNPGGGETFLIRPDRPWGPPSLLYNGNRVLSGTKAAGGGVDHPPLPSAKVKERVELYFYSSSGPSWPVLG